MYLLHQAFHTVIHSQVIRASIRQIVIQRWHGLQGTACATIARAEYL